MKFKKEKTIKNEYPNEKKFIISNTNKNNKSKKTVCLIKNAKPRPGEQTSEIEELKNFPEEEIRNPRLGWAG